MLRLFEPRFLFLSGYSHSCRNLVHVPHFGLTLSHFNFRFRHDTQDIVFSIGAVALSSPGSVVVVDCCCGPFEPPDSEDREDSGWHPAITSSGDVDMERNTSRLKGKDSNHEVGQWQR
jgi:hypothetical protein